jgi:hypothetical protein
MDPPLSDEWPLLITRIVRCAVEGPSRAGVLAQRGRRAHQWASIIQKVA